LLSNSRGESSTQTRPRTLSRKRSSPHRFRLRDTGYGVYAEILKGHRLRSLPFDIELPPPERIPPRLAQALIEAFPGTEVEGPEGIPKWDLSNAPPVNRGRLAQRVYIAVYAARDFLSRASHDSPDPLTQVSLGALGPRQARVTARGQVAIDAAPALALFEAAFDGVHLRRIRRCPECGRFYYAKRVDKQACDEHLTLMRVRRARRKMGKYEESQSFWRRGTLVLPNGDERIQVLHLARKLMEQEDREEEK